VTNSLVPWPPWPADRGDSRAGQWAMRLEVGHAAGSADRAGAPGPLLCAAVHRSKNASDDNGGDQWRRIAYVHGHTLHRRIITPGSSRRAETRSCAGVPVASMAARARSAPLARSAPFRRNARHRAGRSWQVLVVNAAGGDRGRIGDRAGRADRWPPPRQKVSPSGRRQIVRVVAVAC
jgi:hypothetical protein